MSLVYHHSIRLRPTRYVLCQRCFILHFHDKITIRESPGNTRGIHITYEISENSALMLNKQYSKTCVKWSLSNRLKLVFNTNYSLMQVLGGILQYFRSSLSYHLYTVLKSFILSILEWPFYVDFTVHRI